MTQPDEIMVRIAHGIELGQRGERERARQLFGELWQQIDPEEAFHRCGLAHSMADVQRPR